MINRYGTGLLYEQNGITRGDLCWEERQADWYVHSIAAASQRILLALLTAFRDIWRVSGRPVVRFDTQPDKPGMLALVRRYGVPTDPDGLFVITDVECLPIPQEKHHVMAGIASEEEVEPRPARQV